MGHLDKLKKKKSFSSLWSEQGGPCILQQGHVLLGLLISLGALGSVLLQMRGLETGSRVPHARRKWWTERKVFRRNAALPPTSQAFLRVVHWRVVHVLLHLKVTTSRRNLCLLCPLKLLIWGIGQLVV